MQHYVVTPLVTQRGRPKWIDNRTMTIKIGKHSYMSLRKGINAEQQRRTSLQVIDEAYESLYGNQDNKAKK